MRTFADRPKTTQRRASPGTNFAARAFSAQGRETNAIRSPRHAHDFGRVPVRSGRPAPDVRRQNGFKASGTAGGLTGLSLDVTFSASDNAATSLQAIQTVMVTGGPQVVGTYHWTMGAQKWDAFVDGGKNSPYVTLSGNAPAHPTKPYYLTPAEVAAQVTFAKPNGTIRITDTPGAAAAWDEVHFETAIVAVDSRGVDKDRILNVFKWGWTGKGTKPDVAKGDKIAGVDSGLKIIGGTPTPGFSNIVKHDYPSYDFT